jgi:hypothetical protein
MVYFISGSQRRQSDETPGATQKDNVDEFQESFLG